MVPNGLLELLVWTSLLGGLSLAKPSPGSDGLDTSTITLMNDVLSPKSEPLGIGGLKSWRKKRYIIEGRGPRKCCNLIACDSESGEFLNNDCNCTKCEAGKFPAKDGRSCVDKCPEGKPNGKGGCCVGNNCSGNNDNNNNDDNVRKGKCPDGQILDIKEGGQTPDTPDPKCAIDDSKKCTNGQVPQTRFDGDELDVDLELECGDPPEDKECSKGRYKKVSIVYGSDGKSTIITCEPTREFDRKKKDKGKSNEFRDRQRDDWDKRKPQRDEQDADRRKYKEKLADRKKEIEKLAEEVRKSVEESDRKKARMGKCAPVGALMYAVSEASNAARKRDETESPYDWTTDYFDEGFVESGDFLEYWPEGVNVNDIKEVTDEGVDAEAWMKRWEEIVSARELRESPGQCPGSKRSQDIGRRCTKRSVDDYDDFGEIHVYHGTDTLYERFAEAEIEAYQPPSNLMIRDPNYIAARNPVGIIVEIILFALRLGTSLLARTAQAISRYSPRLASLARNTDRLFKVAPRGAGTPRGVEGMKNAMSQIVKNPNFRKCIVDGMP